MVFHGRIVSNIIEGDGEEDDKVLFGSPVHPGEIQDCGWKRRRRTAEVSCTVTSQSASSSSPSSSLSSSSSLSPSSSLSSSHIAMQAGTDPVVNPGNDVGEFGGECSSSCSYELNNSPGTSRSSSLSSRSKSSASTFLVNDFIPEQHPQIHLLPKEETLALRQQYIPTTCSLYFQKAPLKVTRAFGQYLYDDAGIEYLDCVNIVAHVGHCNPSVVGAGKLAMQQLGSVTVDVSDYETEYINKLKTTLPTELDTFLFVTSGSEANDLALQLARLHSLGYDVVAVEGGFHGSLSGISDISTRRDPDTDPPNTPHWAHIINCPDLYRGMHVDSDPEGGEKYIEDAKKLFDDIIESGSKIAAFICEPVMSIAGVVLPPTGWLQALYDKVRSVGGLAIADETQSGLGRTGSEWWGFQYLNVVPDIVTVGKPLGNGYPMAMVVTRSEIAARLGSKELVKYRVDNVAAAIGNAVLSAIRSENLLKNARDVGCFLREGLKALAAEHSNIGHVRGAGLMIGMEIVYSREHRTPAREIAEDICYRLKDKHILVTNEGINKNILFMVPPMCFSLENAHQVIMNVSSVLAEIETDDGQRPQDGPAGSSITGERLISLGVFDDPDGEAFFSFNSAFGRDFSALD